MHHPEFMWCLPFLLYAETHYRFPFFVSWLRKNEPELIADTPFRLEPGAKLPLLILAKDAHTYPCKLEQVTIEIRQEGELKRRADCLLRPIPFDQKLHHHIVTLDVSEFTGWIDVDVVMTIEGRGGTRIYHNDNHRTSSHQPLRVFISKDPLPRFPGLFLGDPHTHSSYTDDQVEFGPPMEAARVLSRAMGLSFFCVTDHSYDLDDAVNSYLQNDPTLAKWNSFQAEVDQLNEQSNDCVIVRGEEVSCRNVRNENVHLLLIGQREFVHGSGDGAERWLRTRSEHSVEEVLRLKSEGTVAYAAHAKEPVPMLQRLLLGRGSWLDSDYTSEGLNGIQIINGQLDEGYHEGYASWVRSLLQGRRLFALAGNDAHGNFNRFRQIGVPFVLIKEGTHQLFGKMRSGIYCPGECSESSITSSLERGDFILTDGPVAGIWATNSSERSSRGGTARGKEINLRIEALSTSEFGEITSVRIIVGKIGDTEEKTAFSFDGNQGYSVHKRISIRESGPGYVRVEVLTSRINLFDSLPHFCITNPTWVTPAP